MAPALLDLNAHTHEFPKQSLTIYFTHHQHAIERKTPEGEIESIQYDNWYIVMFQNKLLFDKQQLKTNKSKTNTTTETDMKGDTHKTINTTTKRDTQTTTPNKTKLDTTKLDTQTATNTTTKRDTQTTTHTSTEIQNTSEHVLPSTTTISENKTILRYVQDTDPSKITVKVLKEYLSSLGLKVSGKKEELLQRLIRHCETFD